MADGMGRYNMNNDKLTTDELIEKIVLVYDPDEVIEILDITTEELLENFRDKVVANKYKFEV
jgi:hypothetical protein